MIIFISLSNKFNKMIEEFKSAVKTGLKTTKITDNATLRYFYIIIIHAPKIPI